MIFISPFQGWVSFLILITQGGAALRLGCYVLPFQGKDGNRNLGKFTFVYYRTFSCVTYCTEAATGQVGTLNNLGKNTCVFVRVKLA